MSGKRPDGSKSGRMDGPASAMNGQSTLTDMDEGLLEEAADWLVQLMSRSATGADAERLAEWRAQSAAHDAAFREVAGVRSYAVVAGSTRKPVSRRTVLSAGGGGAMAALVGFGLARPPLGLWPSYAELMADHRTPVGGRFAFRPIAGVAVEMSSRTSVSLTSDGHGIRLIVGETYVAATGQRSDFEVESSGVRIAVRDAEFNLQALDSQTRVSCVRGQLQCRVGESATALTVDQALTIGPDGSARRSRVDAAKESAWRRGLLVFEGTPLATVVDQINLHRPGRIVLTDRRLSRLPLNAVFHTAQIENSVAQIEQLLNLKARYIAGGVVLLG